MAENTGKLSRSMSISRALETDTSPSIMMEDILEKLKLIDYEKKFCDMKNFKPLNRQYFAMPNPNPNEQFFYFTSLVSWLMQRQGHFFPAPMQYDDPNATATNILQELKKMGFSTDFSPAKLKQGHGDAVCAVLSNLLDYTLESTGFRWQKPSFPPESNFQDDQTIEDEGEASVAEVADEVIGAEDDDDVYAEPALGTTSKKEEDRGTTVIQTQVDPEQWKLELERVEPQLKVVLQPDHKEWRTHVEQTRIHQSTIAEALPETRSQLERILSDVNNAIEKIATREKYINTNLEMLIADYKAAQQKLTEVTNTYNEHTDFVNNKQQRLADITNELDSVKSDMESRNGSMTDTAPVVRIKQSLQRLKTETKQMEIRIGVVEHTLLQARLKNKVSLAAAGAASHPMDFDAIDYN